MIIIKKQNVYFSNMNKIIKHYPMTDRLIVIREYINAIIFRAMYTNTKHGREQTYRSYFMLHVGIQGVCLKKDNAT